MNIPSAASSRKATIEGQRLEMSKLIDEAVAKGKFSLWVRDVHSEILEEVKIQGYKIEMLLEKDNYLISW